MALSLHKAFVHSGPPARIRLIMGTARGCQTGSVQARVKGSSSETNAPANLLQAENLPVDSDSEDAGADLESDSS